MGVRGPRDHWSPERRQNADGSCAAFMVIYFILFILLMALAHYAGCLEEIP